MKLSPSACLPKNLCSAKLSPSVFLFSDTQLVTPDEQQLVLASLLLFAISL